MLMYFISPQFNQAIMRAPNMNLENYHTQQQQMIVDRCHHHTNDSIWFKGTHEEWLLFLFDENEADE